MFSCTFNYSEDCFIWQEKNAFKKWKSGYDEKKDVTEG